MKFRERKFKAISGFMQDINEITVDISGMYKGKVWLVMNETGEAYDRIPALLNPEQAIEVGLALISAAAVAEAESIR